MTVQKRQRQRAEVRHSKDIMAWLVTTILVAAWFAGTCHNLVWAQSAQVRAIQSQPQSNTPSGPRTGEEIFASSCAGCHGLDGRGGERAPNIAGRPAVQQLSD